MKEIGGYIEFERLIHNEYYSDCIALNFARNALVYLARTKNISKVYLPFFLCDSVYKVCQREGISFEFYHIKDNFEPDFHGIIKSNELLYIVNYYGQLGETAIKRYKEEYKNIAIDNVQAFFTPPLEKIDTIYSCRKFFGVSDGAYLVGEQLKLDLPRDRSYDRMRHTFKRYETGIASDFYDAFLYNESKIYDIPLMGMSKITRNILGAVDYSSVKDARNSNWDFLQKELKSKNELPLSFNSGPYAYPFLHEKASDIKKALVKEKIYVPTLWPNVKESTANNTEKEYAENILPLPLDQRYDISDMKRMLEVILEII